MAVKNKYTLSELVGDENMTIADIQNLIDSSDPDAELYVEVEDVTYSVGKVKATYTGGGITEITLVAEE